MSPHEKTQNVHISYNHIDQYFKDQLSEMMKDTYNITSSPQEYYIKNNFNKYIEELKKDNLTKENILIVLIGTDTYKTQSVNWEIEYGLKQDSCIIGLCLPTNDDYKKEECNPSHIPQKLVNNLYTGYASYFDWTDNIDELIKYINFSYNQKSDKHAFIY